ncbi:hypothetical protein UFOVP474_21 [uncultured Caudovirales phage]|uniref:Uncharacterized protein n=1 Tax=uncultured Caudovirales phage TaxID=2100421 RepID=A0A6J5R4P3_9CAUD|nr:hypothetical protein UFOVP474_21 [uncultured Caudovirales phage]CAB4189577.1 hypothetical protein UFOVP1207_17 [uncultured Caudovirales phage]
MSNSAYYSLLNDGKLTGDMIGAVEATPPVAVTGATLTCSRDVHGGRTIVINAAAGCAVTLPNATGTGSMYRFVIGTTITSNSTTIKVNNATDVMAGRAFVISDGAAAVLGYATAASSDTITLNGTTLGGLVGDHIEIIDAIAGTYAVRVFTAATGTEATPFSATV